MVWRAVSRSRGPLPPLSRWKRGSSQPGGGSAAGHPMSKNEAARANSQCDTAVPPGNEVNIITTWKNLGHARVHPEPLSLIDLQTSAVEQLETLLHFLGLVTKPRPSTHAPTKEGGQVSWSSSLLGAGTCLGPT